MKFFDEFFRLLKWYINGLIPINETKPQNLDFSKLWNSKIIIFKCSFSRFWRDFGVEKKRGRTGDYLDG